MVLTAILLLTAIAVGTAAFGFAQYGFTRRLRDTEELFQAVRNLLDTPESQGDGWVTEYLERLARLLGADSAWMLIGTKLDSAYVWSIDRSWSLTDARTLTDTVTTRFPWRGDRMMLAPDRGSEVMPGWLSLYYAPYRANTLLLRSLFENEVAILGFTERALLRTKPELINAVTFVFGAMLQTLRRQSVERRQLKHDREMAVSRRMETIGTFASGMAHNLNNVIAAIAGFNAITELHAKPDSVIGRSAADIETAVRRAQLIVREVLSFGRRLERAGSTIDASELVAETTAMMAVSLPPGIRLDVKQPEERWQIDGNFGHLQQVILNICNNAALAMPRGGTIEMAVRRVVLDATLQTSHALLAPGAYVTIAIRDQGAGMERDVLRRIFDPFFTTRQGGTGLGLSTAQEFVQKHAGAIDVSSRLGSGSEFTVWLPAASDVSANTAATAVSGNGQVVLIINADASHLAIDEELVAALGYEPSGLLDPDGIDDFEGYIDVVVIAGTDESTITSALDAVRASKWTVPVIVAGSISSDLDVTALKYPFRPVDLADALTASIASSTPSDPEADPGGAAEGPHQTGSR